MQILRAAVLYFAVVFAAGFVLGTIRTLWIVPRLGTRTAELMEAPLMLVAILAAAHWVVRHQAPPASPAKWLVVGLVGLGFLLLAEFGIVLWLRKLSLAEYLANRDPVAGSVYLVMLAIFAIMPLLAAKR
jgi:phosphate/sulfate permease